MNNKRIRTPNYTYGEKMLLVNLISNFKNIIENKRTDSNSNREKDEAWETITERFNEATTDNVYRTKESIKRWYETQKKEIKKVATEQRKEPFNGLNDPITDIAHNITSKAAISLCNEYCRNSLLSLSQNSQNCDGQENPEPKPDENLLTTSIELKVEPSDVNEELDISNHNPDIVNIDSVNHNISWENYATKDVQSKMNRVKNVAKRKGPLNTESWTRRKRLCVTRAEMEAAERQKEFYQNEMDISRRREEREEEEFALRKRNLLLDIELKELQLKKLKSGF